MSDEVASQEPATSPERASRGSGPRPWAIEAFGHRWTDDGVSAAHLALVALIVGDEWADMTPWRGPLRLMAWLTALLVNEENLSLDVAQQKVSAMSAEELIGSLSERES